MPGVAEWKRSLLDEVGAGLEGLPDPVLARVLDRVTPFLDTYWEMHARYDLVYPGLRYLYVKRHCVNVLLGQVRDLTQVSVGSASVPQNQLGEALNKLYGNVTAEIKDMEERAKGSRPPAWANVNNPVVMDGLGRIYRTDRPVVGNSFFPPTPPPGVHWGNY